jgi:hypothetical protein
MTELKTDSVVIGSGIAGYASALAAAETNNVILIDKHQTVGGATTQSNVGTLCGFYYSSPEAKLIPHPFCENFVRTLLQSDSQAHVISLPHNLHVIAYEWLALQRMLYNHLATSNNITLLLGYAVTTATTEDHKIKTIHIKNSEDEKIIHCKAVVDCSGTGYLAQLLAHPMIHDAAYQSAAQVIRLSNVSDTNEYALNLALKRSLLKNSDNNDWPESYKRISIVPGSLRNNSVDLKIPLATIITDNPRQAIALQDEINTHLQSLLVAFRETESLKDAVPEIIFPVPGIRTQQRPQGQYTLTAAEVLQCTKAVDGIAVGTWPVEEWDNTGKVSMEYLAGHDGYTIPARCLMSPVYKNLFFAGKGISAEAKAIASARVTGTCLQTGYAAGKLSTCSTPDEQQAIITHIQRQWNA